MGVAVGSRQARLAHRVLGDGGVAARARLRDPRRRRGSDLPAPRERGRADVSQRGARRSHASGCTTGWCVSTSRRWPSRSGNISVLSEALEAHGRDALILYFCGGHYRQPIEFDEQRLEQAAASVRRIREAARTLVDGPSPASWSPALKSRVLRRARRGLQHAARAGCAVRVGQRGQPGRRGRRRRATCARCWRSWDSPICSMPTWSQAPADVRELREARERARAARDYAEADRLRDAIRARGWEVRDGPGGPELLRRT